MNTLQNQSVVDTTKENGVVTTEIFDTFCTKCMQPYSKDCEICSGTGSAVIDVIADKESIEKITALHCKYGCNSMRLCKGRCAKTN